jgi:hypothetical protein
MNEILLQIGYKDDYKPIVSVPLTQSGFVGKKSDVLFYSNEYLFFNENEIICKVVYDHLVSLTIQSLGEFDIFSVKNFYSSLSNSKILKKVIGGQYEMVQIGEYVYMDDVKYTFSIFNNKYLLKLNNVSHFISPNLT